MFCVIDDESNIRELIKKYANFEGYDVYEATNGLEAIDVVNKTDPDSIFFRFFQNFHYII